MDSAGGAEAPKAPPPPKSATAVSCSFVITCWDRADLFALLYVKVSCVFVSFPYDVLGQIVSIPDLCLLPYFYFICPHFRLIYLYSVLSHDSAQNFFLLSFKLSFNLFLGHSTHNGQG